MKRGVVVFCFIILLLILPFVVAQDEANEPGIDVTENIEEPEELTPRELDVDPGLTPDSAFYFMDDLGERILVGDNPERALDYKEEKIAEAEVMIQEGKPEEAKQVLEKALEYGDIVAKEVSPEINERAKESSETIRYVLGNLEQETSGNEWREVREKFGQNIEKEKQIATAAELAAKINELCETLAQLDPLQYSDTCKSGDSSPKWMRVRDRELTEEQEQQAKIFFDKLSKCMETPKNCDCKGMGIQSFEEFCIEKSSLAVSCEEGDKDACLGLEEADPTDVLPDYLVDVFYKAEGKYSKAKFDMFMPPECVEAGAKNPEECNKIMFQLNAPQECIDAGLTGKTREDEKKCRELMFNMNTPQECIDAGIKPDNRDAPRKCAKIMFQLNAPQECIDAGLTGEKREDEKKCREIMEGKRGGEGPRPRFNRNCNSIQDANEKVKCYEEFYNNAQVNMNEDFRERAGESGKCQTQEQIERLKQDCKNHGEDARVEDRGGCPWVICVREGYKEEYREERREEYKVEGEDGFYGTYEPYKREERVEPMQPQPPVGPGPVEGGEGGYVSPGEGGEVGPGPGEGGEVGSSPPSEGGGGESVSSEGGEGGSSESPSSETGVTGGVVSIDQGNSFLDYWFK